MTSLARLQAGQEQREVAPFDAAELLRELSENLQSFASERGLYLKADGPATLPVEGDVIKTRRIAQNLLLNAPKYTQQGGVTISWEDSQEDDTERWMLRVQDTGPAFHAGPGAPSVGALIDATIKAREKRERGKERSEPAPNLFHHPTSPQTTVYLIKSEAKVWAYLSSRACVNCWTQT
ncbi:MAG TPA: HAMP domain-containing sensor histidine kinase [Gammaproteobacteria bacterium]|nr:HAMP domain-containing sensor histidine kinase [Gammaproteobacteria bacterium]